MNYSKHRNDFVKRIEESDLQPLTRLVAFSLANRMNNKTGDCYPTQEYISKTTGMSEKSVRRHTSVLEEEGFIVRTSHKRGKHTNYSYYLVAYDRTESPLLPDRESSGDRTESPDNIVYEHSNKHSYIKREKEQQETEVIYGHKDDNDDLY